jgi:hypothetical protein
MLHALLVLILFGPADRTSGDRVTAQVATLLGSAGTVKSGAEAIHELGSHGVKDGDLLASPEIGDQLTRQSPELVVVRLDTRTTGGDAVVESTIWVHGHHERHVSIAGGGRDAVEGAVRGVLGIIAPLIPDAEDHGTGDDDARLPQLAHGEHWQELLAVVAPYGPPPPQQSARTFYYEVLALVHLQRLAAAQEALQRMRAQWPTHVLTGAADSLLHSEQSSPPEPTPSPATASP